MAFKLSSRDHTRLAGVHHDLTAVLLHAASISALQFIIVEGLRTKTRQQELFNAGASTTLRSRHITGHAVDIAPIVSGEVRWDWPLFHTLGALMKAAAAEVRIPIEWGGDWKRFPDGPHFQLPWKEYP